MLNFSALYPYFLVALVSSTLVPGTAAARRGRSSLSYSNVTVTKGDTSVNLLSQGPSETQLTMDPSSIALDDEKLLTLSLCVLGSGNCYFILSLIRLLQIELNCLTIVALQIRLSTGYDAACTTAIKKCCGILGLPLSIVTILLSVISLKENTLEVAGDNRTVIEVNPVMMVESELNGSPSGDSDIKEESESSEVTGVVENSTRGTSCNCNLLGLINQVVLRININASLQCRYPDIRYCSNSLLQTLCNTCVCATIVIG